MRRRGVLARRLSLRRLSRVRCLLLASGFEVGDGQVTVTLTDEIGRKVSRTFTVTVTAREWEAGAPPNYPHAPIILYDGNDVPG